MTSDFGTPIISIKSVKHAECSKNEICAILHRFHVLQINSKITVVIFIVDLLFIIAPIVGVLYCSIFCYAVLYVLSSFEFILMGKGELVSFFCLSGVL